MESKIFMVVTLLKTEGDTLTAQGKTEESRQYYLKGIHLLLGAFGQTPGRQRPDFVPTVETFVFALRDTPLASTTNAMLMQYYERIGNYAKAEDALFEILEADATRPELLEFGRLFYQRLLNQNDDALSLGNLPRAEVQAGLAELDRRKAGLG